MEDYIVVEELGRGSYGLVTLVEHVAYKKQLVQKRIDLTTCSLKAKRGALLEVKLLSTMRHPNIVRYKDSVEANGVLHILMEYCENGDLHTKIKHQSGEPFDESQILNWFVQVCMALQVGDFGIARILEGSTDMATTLVGTPVYMSPEVLTNKPYNYKSDIWSLGCCLVELCTLKTAFMAKDLGTLLQRILRGRDIVFLFFHELMDNRGSAYGLPVYMPEFTVFSEMGGKPPPPTKNAHTPKVLTVRQR